MKTTDHFEDDVLRERPYLQRGWCERVRREPEEKSRQSDGRNRHWGRVPELAEALAKSSGKKPEECTGYLRVVTLEDGDTIHTAMPGRNYARRKRR